jgi:hypothetical protein
MKPASTRPSNLNNIKAVAEVRAVAARTMRLRIEHRGRDTSSVAEIAHRVGEPTSHPFPGLIRRYGGLGTLLDAMCAFDEIGGLIPQLSLEHLAKRISR